MSYPSPTEPLFTIHSDDVSTQVINRITAIFPVSGKSMQQLRIRAVNKLSVLALDAARSTVPVRTEDLRNKYVIRNYFASANNPEAQIIVSSAIHGADSSKIPADVLSAILDRGWHQKKGQAQSADYTRSRDAHTENLSSVLLYRSFDAGTPTKDWTNEAKKLYKDSRRSLSKIG